MLRIELLQNTFQPARGVMITGRQLEKETTHPLIEQIGNETKIPNKRFSAGEPLHVGDEFADFHRIDKVAPPDLTVPG
jgi:hypothetical protein